MKLGRKVYEYMTETIETKRALKRQIEQMRIHNDKLMDNIQERDLNMKDILKQKDTYKSQLRQYKRDLTEANKRIKELEKELKKVSK